MAEAIVGTVEEVLRAAVPALAAISDTPLLDAQLLMAHALGIEREALLLGGARNRTVPDGFAVLLARRLAHEPIAYIVGHRDFWTIRLMVGPGALIPRADSETLLDAAVAQFGPRNPAHILDIGTGPGSLLFAALDQWPDAMGVGIERSVTARAWALRNRTALGMEARADVRMGDWTAPGWADDLGTFDLILCNPPYVETSAVLDRQVFDHEPAEALFAGGDGLKDYQVIMPVLPALLAPKGMAIFEIGHAQAVAVIAIACAVGLQPALYQDLGGRDRALVLRK